ncbi:hypothetical protein EZH22_05930 [Xanthobacter dioxanivorans]|uniref:Uncharacterized protein n=1 Tax=Xanthobacter dioxanivorans TaxID=2528964 RepID=A0A974PQP6_9HYPH|nr:hypothetical protein [Xanthobacter dioxanivorans]QRG07905.1 hypothetical protein EZH22_05930 [Xanthobacter dioxanivorans]
MFGDAWSDAFFGIGPLPFLPASRQKAGASAGMYAAMLLGRERPSAMSLPEFTNEEWSRALELAEYFNKEPRAKKAMAEDAVRKFSDEISSGNIHIHLRAKKMPIWHVLPLAWISVIGPSALLYDGRVNARDPRKDVGLNDDFAWVYADKIGVERLVRDLARPLGGQVNLTAATISKATKMLTQHFRSLKDLGRDPEQVTREEAAAIVGMDASSKPFKNDVWPNARVAANLSRRATPGPKRSKSTA